MFLSHPLKTRITKPHWAQMIARMSTTLYTSHLSLFSIGDGVYVTAISDEGILSQAAMDSLVRHLYKPLQGLILYVITVSTAINNIQGQAQGKNAICFGFHAW